MSIKLENVSKSYGRQPAIKNISFELKPGEITGFIGPNGSGKSTTMKIICGILSPDAGKVFINSKEIRNNNTDIKKNIGYLAENNPLYYEMYVKEYLAHIAGLYKLHNQKSKIDEIIQLTGLTSEYKKKIGNLSKGYRQRVGLAQALIHDPQILILDEPTTGLDPNQILEIRKLIQNLSGTKTVLLSTHILQEVEAICDKVIIINKGEIVADQSTAQIGSESGTAQIIFIEFDTEVKDSIIQKIPNIDSFRKISGSSWLLESSSVDEKNVRKTIFEFSVNNHLTILSMQKKDKNLEESFREIIERHD
jgi:ABC-2 type transport system ATP-binding protein